MAARRRTFLHGMLSLPVGSLLARHALPGVDATVHNGFELDAVLQGAGPGSTVTLAPGNYGDVGRFVLAGSDVSLRVQSPLRTVFRSPVVVQSHGGTLDGLAFHEGLSLIGNGLTITNSRFTGTGLEVSGVNTEVSYCEIGNFRGRGIGITATARNPVVHHNYIHDSLAGASGNSEGIRVGESTSNTDLNMNGSFQYNLLEKLNAENEAVSIKCSGNFIYFNTLLNSKAFFDNRHGERNLYAGNTSVSSLGFVTQDRGNWYLGNKCVGGTYGFRVMCGTVSADSKVQGQWPQAVGAYFCGNTGNAFVGYAFSGQTLPALNTMFAGPHNGTIKLQNYVGVDYNATPVSVPAPVFLTPPDVGPRTVGSA